ncbi:protein of unknown function DUF190 [Thermocrinis albus DSM 14484]|uniref:Uncharacterized protein n=1 Tax=Thermocrinis albus (strain DSM 14484 / JCM 11386 / HI 11/12) TaxID=638303 RepID=D3SME6_THEAH|nr:DUF190 domain-containing protein [Thermocrinis albus]ADC89926.1 protein of unknown function DUF190 [Thermocrinis albus DSM 14484]
MYQEAVLLRIFLGENDTYRGKPLYRYIVEFCKEKGVAGATVFKGVLGYGRSSVLHGSSILRLSSDLPIVVEIIDSEEKIVQVLPHIKGMLKGGIITLEKVKVIVL